MDAMLNWVKKNRTPPPSKAPMISDCTLVAPEEVDFPAIPANEYGGISRPDGALGWGIVYCIFVEYIMKPLFFSFYFLFSLYRFLVHIYLSPVLL